MSEILKIGRGLNEVDYQTETYWYYGRNPGKVSKGEEERNKRKIDGFTRILRNGRTKKFRYRRG